MMKCECLKKLIKSELSEVNRDWVLKLPFIALENLVTIPE